MNNIFEGTKFGDKFLRKINNELAIFSHFSNDKKMVYLLLDKKINKLQCWEINTNDFIKYQEHIDENKLDELANGYADAIFGKKETHVSSKVTVYHSISKEDFKAGYKKAKEE